MSEKLVEMSHSLRELLGSIGKEEGLEDAMAGWQTQIDDATSDMAAEFGTAQSINEMHELLIKTKRIPLNGIGIDGLTGLGKYRPLVPLRDELTQNQMKLVLSKLGISISTLDDVKDISHMSPAGLSAPHKYGDDFVGVPTQVKGVFCNGTIDAAKNISAIPT